MMRYECNRKLFLMQATGYLGFLAGLGRIAQGVACCCKVVSSDAFSTDRDSAFNMIAVFAIYIKHVPIQGENEISRTRIKVGLKAV